MSTAGNVYILTNPAMPGLVKIGKTSRIAEELVKELNTTGVPASFKIAHQRKVEHMDRVERDMHQHFNTQRENRDREFFKIATDEANGGERRVVLLQPRVSYPVRHQLERQTPGVNSQAPESFAFTKSPLRSVPAIWH